jgi:hypothetical protein
MRATDRHDVQTMQADAQRAFLAEAHWESGTCERCAKATSYPCSQDVNRQPVLRAPEQVYVCNHCARILFATIKRPDLVPDEGATRMDRSYFDELRSYL